MRVMPCLPLLAVRPCCGKNNNYLLARTPRILTGSNGHTSATLVAAAAAACGACLRRRRARMRCIAVAAELLECASLVLFHQRANSRKSTSPLLSVSTSRNTCPTLVSYN